MPGTTSVEMSRTYTSFSGTDIRAVIAGETFGTLQAISYAIQREKAPVYTMGHPDPLSFSRGKRGIAGTIVSLLFDRHILYNKVFDNLKFVADKDEVYPSVSSLNDATNTADLSLIGGDAAAEFNEADIGSNYQLNRAWYVDQLVPFDVVIVAANEYGKAATMRIYGVEILNEGSGFSVDDIVIESQMTYVCRTILPWQRLGSWNMTINMFTPNAPEDIAS